MIISVVNLSRTVLDAELQNVIRAVNRQIREDFAPYWRLGATLRLEGKTSDNLDKVALPELRGDAVLYLWDDIDVEGALGYHDRSARGIPYSIVFTHLSELLQEPWSVTLSHEALELIADPQINLLVAGPHPAEDREVYHWYEMSDAVQAQTYEVDGLKVSNFVLPLYFTADSEPGSRNDFLGGTASKTPLLSFGISPGGYIGFFDPVERRHVTYARKDDERARHRLLVKGQATTGRRSHRVGWPREAALAASSESPTRPDAEPAPGVPGAPVASASSVASMASMASTSPVASMVRMTTRFSTMRSPTAGYGLHVERID